MLHWTATTALLALLSLWGLPRGLLTPRPAAAGLTHRVSVSRAGVPGNSDSSAPSLSANGRFVAFASEATTLVPGDTNGDRDIFVHDRDADDDGVFDEPGAIATHRVSVSSSGTQGNNDSDSPSLSADGRFVAFQSRPPPYTYGFWDIFVHDRDADGDGVFDEPGAIATRRVSVSSSGTQGNDDSFEPSLSADGRVVAFASRATNLVPGDTNGTEDIFVHDRDADEDGVFDEPGAIATRRVSVSSSGTQGNDDSFEPSLSADGRVVAFASRATNLVPGDTYGFWNIFVHDRDADEDGVFDEPGAIATRRVSVASSGAQGNHYSYRPSLSADGRVVAFRSSATNLVPGDTNGTEDIFVHDRDADDDGVFDEPGAIATRRVSVRSSGAQGNGNSDSPSLSADGRVVAFQSLAATLVPGDTNGTWDIFVHDRDADDDGVFDEPGAIATRRVSVRSSGAQGNDWSYSPSLSADGRVVAFSSSASTLVFGDTNRRPDIFVHDRLGVVKKVCGGFAVTILGTPGPDVLVGTAGPDVIHGWWGNDIIRGGGGDDLLCGSFGNDILEGGDGNDRLRGGLGDDQLRGGPGDDHLFGETGADTLDGGAGHDRCDGGTPEAGDTAVACETGRNIP